jgi:tetratricopeptide (TPR) repeat protein
VLPTLRRWLLRGESQVGIAGRDAAAAGRDAFVNCNVIQIGIERISWAQLTRLVAEASENATAPLNQEIASLSRRLKVSEGALTTMLADIKKAGVPRAPGMLADGVRRHKEILSDLEALKRDACGFAEIYEEIQGKMKAGDLDGAEALLDSNVAAGDERIFENTQEHAAQLILVQANIAFLRFRYAEAGRRYLQAGGLLEHHDAFEAAVCLIDGSNSLYLGGDALAEQTALKARIALNACEERDDLFAAHAYKRLGNILLDLGHPIEAEESLRKAVHQFWASRDVADPVDVADSLLSLSLILERSARDAEARPLWDQALALLERAGHDAGSEMTKLVLRACVLQRLDRDEEALKYAKRQLAEAKKALGANHPWLCTSNNLVGGILHDLGRHAQALSYARRSLGQREIAVGPGHPMVIEDLRLLVLILIELARPDEAEPLARRALKIARTHPHAPRIELGQLLGLLGCVLFRRNQPDAAERAFTQGLKALRTAGNPKRTAEALLSFAINLDLASRPQKAERLFREALSIRKSIYDVAHPAVIEVLVALGVFLFANHRFEEGTNTIILALQASPENRTAQQALEQIKRKVGYKDRIRTKQLKS